MSSNTSTYFVNAKLKVKKQDSCTICNKVCNSKTLVVKERIIGLLIFLIEEIDTNVLDNSQICEVCFNQIKEACDFKIAHRAHSERETKLEIKKEEDNDENLVMCYNCKNIISENSSRSLFDGAYLDMYRYFVAKEDLNPLVNPKICNICQASISKLQAIMSLLSVYDTRNVHETHADDAFVEEGTKLIVDVINVKEEKLDIEIDDIPIEDMEIKIEEVILKTDSNDEFVEEGTKLIAGVVKVKEEKLDMLSDDEDSSEVGIWNHREADQTVLNKTDGIQKYQTQRKSEYHMLVDNGVDETEMFKCEECEYETNQKHSMKKHMLVHKIINETEMFGCQQCEYKTIYRYYLKTHSLVHKSVGETEMFRCEQCEYQTNRKYSLKIHMLVHKSIDEIKMFRCEQCEYKTKHKSHLKKHMLVHKRDNETKLFKCLQYERQTNYKSRLKKQINS